MNKKSNQDNNIFKWATKELSQDAIVAWLLANPETDTAFVKSLLKKKCPENFTIDDIETQKNSIDVLVTIKVDGEKQAIIIEDKTSTFLHDNQMLRYIKTVADKRKYSKIYFVLFKTGIVYSWEREEFERQRDLIEKGNKMFSLEKLNDYYSKDKKLIISGSYNKKEIDFTNNISKIILSDIYTLENFNEFLNENNIDNAILGLIKSYYKENDTDKSNDKETKEKIYDMICAILENLKNKDREYTVRTIIPKGGGKRDYDICIHCDDYIKYKEDNFNLIKPDKKSENYLILPFVRFVKKDDESLKIEFSINYNIISDLKKLHGYQPYLEMKKTFSGLDWYESAQDDLRKKYKEDPKLVKRNKENQLKFITWTVDINNSIDKTVVEENVKSLIKYADEIRNYLDQE